VKRVEEPGALLLYEGQLARVVGIATGKTIILELVEHSACAECGAPARIHVLEDSRLFQEKAEPVPTVGEW
jgi:hypothetical protein